MKSKKLLAIYVLIVVVVFSLIVDAVEIMGLEDIKPEMKGMARTVFQGYKVEEFPVEIINIFGDQGLDNNLILFKASGEKIEEAGGIASGMSGSPVYVDDKLIGAIAYGWPLADHRYGMITPIEHMMELLDKNPADEKNTGKTQLKTPLYVSGMQGRSFERMKNEFEDLGFQVLQTAGLSTITSTQEPLGAGSAVAVQLVRGDISIGSIGTLTYKESGDILAFGHSFFNKGDVDYLLSRAYINTVIPSIQSPFKLGSITNDLIGSVTVDRSAGVAGRLNKYPKIIPLSIKVSDIEKNKINNINVQLVKDEDLLTSLITNVSLEALDSTLDRVGRGTANVNLKITGKGLPDLGIERNNIFYSRNDIAAVALYELYDLFNIINTNPFKKVELIDIKLDVEINNTDNVALIQEAKVLNDKVKPGDTLEIELTLLPYRSNPVVQYLYLDLPEDINTGMATLVIDGGFTGESYQSLPEDESDMMVTNQAIIEGYKDLDSILEDYLARAKNNELIVQVYRPYSPVGMNDNNYTPEAVEEDSVVDKEEDSEEKTKNDIGEDDLSKDEAAKNNHSANKQEDDINSQREEEIRELFPTDYVLEGSLFIDLNIEGELEDINLDISNSSI